MKKITKDKKNWFKVQFEKHPYLFTFVIGWIILYFIIDELIISGVTGARFDDVLLIIFLSFPPIIFFLWFRKNKSIIIPFFKRRKKILKPILYTLAGVSLWLTTTIISIGGLTNFGERALFEYIIAHQESKNKDYCETYGGSVGAVSYAGYGGFKHYFHKAEIQFLDYYGEYRDLSDEETKKAESFLPFYKGDPETQVQLAINFKNKSKSDFNHCTFTRLLLRAAHQNNEVAKKILTSYSYNMMGSYVFYDDDRPFFLSKDFYLFNKYIKKINSEKDLDNPALTYVYANNAGAGKRNKYYVQAPEGYKNNAKPSQFSSNLLSG